MKNILLAFSFFFSCLYSHALTLSFTSTISSTTYNSPYFGDSSVTSGSATTTVTFTVYNSGTDSEYYYVTDVTSEGSYTIVHTPANGSPTTTAYSWSGGSVVYFSGENTSPAGYVSLGMALTPSTRLAVESFSGDVVSYSQFQTLGSAQQQLPQRKLSWDVSNSNALPATSANMQTWAVFQFLGSEPTGIAFANRTLAAGETATLTIYVAQDDPYNYAPARVDYQLSFDTYGGMPINGTSYGLSSDGTTDYTNPQYIYMEGALPVEGSTGTVGNYGTATQVTSIPSGTTGPGVDNVTPILNKPSPSTGGSVSITPGSGGSTSSTDDGIASAVQQGSNAIITAINNTGQATRNAVDRASSAIVQAFSGIGFSGVREAIISASDADAAARQAEQAAHDGIESGSSQGAIASDFASRDSQLSAKDSEMASLFSGVGGGMTSDKVTPVLSSGDSSAWVFDLGLLGVLDINPFTNEWVQNKLPFLNWLVAFFRVSIVWVAQVAFYRWLMNTIKDNAISYMHTPSPPPTIIEGVASSNPFTAALGKLGSVFSSVFLAILILSSLSTLVSVVSTWGTVSGLVSSIADGTSSLSSSYTGLGASTGYLGRIVYLVTTYIPVGALLSIGANYVIIETGLVTTMPVLIFAMRIRRW